jgi:hypothetical protein
VGLKVGLEMSKHLLTAHQVRAITKPGIYKDGGDLRLVVTPTGTKRWGLWVSVRRKRREFGLGIFPNVSLAEARETADDIRRAARKGIDLRKQQCEEQAREISFRQAFNAYFGSSTITRPLPWAENRLKRK